MRQRVDIEQEKFKLLKAIRTNIRLKHSLLADDEVNEILPQVEQEIDDAIAAGVPYHFDVDRILNGDRKALKA